MENNLLIIFIVLNILNVIIQTAKSIVTIKCGKTFAAIVNAIAYGLYTIVVVYMMCDLNLYLKAFIVAMCNLIGVYVVKFIEEKTQKDRLWRVEATVKPDEAENLIKVAQRRELSFSYIDIEKYVIINFYCPTQADSLEVKKLLNGFNAKYFVTETKDL